MPDLKYKSAGIVTRLEKGAPDRREDCGDVLDVLGRRRIDSISNIGRSHPLESSGGLTGQNRWSYWRPRLQDILTARFRRRVRLADFDQGWNRCVLYNGKNADKGVRSSAGTERVCGGRSALRCTESRAAFNADIGSGAEAGAGL